MNVKNSCNCRGEKLTASNYNDFLFVELQQTNKNMKDRAIVIYGNDLTSFDYNMAIELGNKIYAKIIAGSTSLNDIIHYENPVL